MGGMEWVDTGWVRSEVGWGPAPSILGKGGGGHITWWREVGVEYMVTWWGGGGVVEEILGGWMGCS